MKEISFSLMHMFEESSAKGERFVEINSDTFLSIKPSFHITIEDTYYEVITKKEKNYVCFTFDFGKANPRDSQVTNVITGKKKDNPRKEVEAELLKQIFCLYSFDRKILYISNYKKLTLFLNVLEKKLKRSFMAKSVFKDKEAFISILESVNKISFTEALELFNQDSKTRKALTDLTGTSAPEKFTIEAEYKHPFEIVPFLRKLWNAKDDDKLKDLMICGKDDKGFSVVFNQGTFLKKLVIKCDTENGGKFNAETVISKLLEEVS